MGSSGTGSDVVVVTIDRTCAKQLLVALTLALGGSPVKYITKGKGKGKGGGKSTASVGGKSSTGGKKTTGKTATAGKSASLGGKSASLGGKSATGVKSGKKRR